MFLCVSLEESVCYTTQKGVTQQELMSFFSEETEIDLGDLLCLSLFLGSSWCLFLYIFGLTFYFYLLILFPFRSGDESGKSGWET